MTPLLWISGIGAGKSAVSLGNLLILLDATRRVEHRSQIDRARFDSESKQAHCAVQPFEAVVVLDSNPALNPSLFQDAPSGRRSYSSCETIFGLGRPDKAPSRDDRAGLLYEAERSLPPNFFAVFRALLSFANYGDGVCIPSHEAIAERLASKWNIFLSVRTVRRALDEARRLGLISWRRRLVHVLNRAGRVICAARTSNCYAFWRRPTADDFRPASQPRKPRDSRAAGVFAWLNGASRAKRSAVGSDPPPIVSVPPDEAAAAHAFFFALRAR